MGSRCVQEPEQAGGLLVQMNLHVVGGCERRKHGTFRVVG